MLWISYPSSGIHIPRSISSANHCFDDPSVGLITFRWFNLRRQYEKQWLYRIERWRSREAIGLTLFEFIRVDVDTDDFGSSSSSCTCRNLESFKFGIAYYIRGFSIFIVIEKFKLTLINSNSNKIAISNDEFLRLKH